MMIQQAMTIFDTLSQETRLRAFRLLVNAGSQGLAAGAIGKALDTQHNTLSFHLSHLQDAGIVSSRKLGRSVIYSANFDAVGGLIKFLIKDCCSSEIATIREDHAKGCSIVEISDCCQPVVESPLSKAE